MNLVEALITVYPSADAKQLVLVGMMPVFFLPLAVLGFEPQRGLFALALNLSCRRFLHTRWMRKLPGAVEFVFNTPSHHGVHHGRNEEYIDRNVGGTLIIRDRLFGAFVEERDDLPPEYGITRQLHSYNPVWLTLHEWADLARNMAGPGPLWQRLKHLWMPPEWQHPQAGESAKSRDEQVALSSPAAVIM